MTVAKFRISSYFAEMTSIVSCFRKYHSKVMKRFRNRKKLENNHFSCLMPPKMAGNCAYVVDFSTLVDFPLLVKNLSYFFCVCSTQV